MHGRISKKNSTKRPIQTVGDICVSLCLIFSYLSIIDMLLSQKLMLSNGNSNLVQTHDVHFVVHVVCKRCSFVRQTIKNKCIVSE